MFNFSFFFCPLKLHLEFLIYHLFKYEKFAVLLLFHHVSLSCFKY